MSDGRRAGEGRDESVRIYASRLKLGLLATPCLIVAYGGLQALLTGAGSGWLYDVGMILAGLGSGLVLLQMGFTSEPVIEIDARGITCRRPKIGLLPWHAVAGLAIGRVALLRSVLMIALDERAAGPALMERLKPHLTSGTLSPTVTRFKGQMQDRPTIQVAIAFLATSPHDLQRLIEEKVRYADRRR